jgi:hypothetical protein
MFKEIGYFVLNPSFPKLIGTIRCIKLFGNIPSELLVKVFNFGSKKVVFSLFPRLTLRYICTAVARWHSNPAPRISGLALISFKPLQSKLCLCHYPPPPKKCMKIADNGDHNILCTLARATRLHTFLHNKKRPKCSQIHFFLLN